MILFPPVLIRASAGTGKTYALSSRYIGLLAAGERPDRILATTFTRKAAAEIQERIFQRLAKAALNEEEALKLGKDFGEDEFSMRRASLILKDLVQNQHRLRVSTLDSFFFSVAESFSLDLGLMLGWQIADPESEQEVLRDALRSLCEHESVEKVVKLLQLVYGGSARRSVHERLEEQLQEIFDIYRATDPNAWHRLHVRKGITDDELEEAITALQNLPIPQTAARQPVKAWQNAVSKDVELAKAKDWKAFIAAGIAKKILDNEKEFNRKPIGDDFRAVYGKLIAQARSYLLGQIRAQTEGMFELMKRFESEYEAQRVLRQTLSFTDVKKRLLDAEITGRLEEVYYRLDSRIAHLLLDEFQDTSGEEWRVIKPVVDEIRSKSGLEYSFFCVGDAKQAIYGWRGGVAEIFDTLEGDGLKGDSQNKSWRCAWPIIHFVNSVFSDLRSNDALAEQEEAAASWGLRYQPHESGRETEAGFVKCSFLSARTLPSGEPMDKRTLLIEELIETVRRVRAVSSEAVIGILVRRNQDVAELLFELGRHGFAASEEGGVPLTDSPAVNVFLSLLRMTDHPGDLVSRFHLSHSALGPVLRFPDYRDDDRARDLSYEIRNMLLREGYGRTLNNLSRQVSTEASTRDRRRLEQLTSLAFAFERRKTTRVSDFIRLIEKIRMDDPSAESIRVMTIHQSKGLEFDAVIMPVFDGTMLRSNRSSVLCEYDDPTAPPVRVVRGMGRDLVCIDKTLRNMYESEARGRFSESLSVLYVALTRARDALFVICDRGDISRDLNYTSMLHKSLSEQLSKSESGEVFESGTLDGLWSQGAPEIRRAVMEETAEKVFPCMPGERSRGLARLAPSSLEGKGSRSLALKLGLNPPERVLYGHVMHECAAATEWLSPENMPSVAEVKGVLSFVSDDGKLLDRAARNWLGALREPSIRRIFDREYYSGMSGVELIEVFREHPFAVRDGNSIYSGAFDRLIITRGRKADRAFLYDFKTTSMREFEEEKINDLERYYSPQLQAYKRAVRRIFDIDEGMIETSLVFIGDSAARLVRCPTERKAAG